MFKTQIHLHIALTLKKITKINLLTHLHNKIIFSNLDLQWIHLLKRVQTKHRHSTFKIASFSCLRGPYVTLASKIRNFCVAYTNLRSRFKGAWCAMVQFSNCSSRLQENGTTLTDSSNKKKRAELVVTTLKWQAKDRGTAPKMCLRKRWSCTWVKICLRRLI